MEQLVILGFILVFSILEAVARGRKGKEPALPPPEEWGEYVGDDDEEEWSIEAYDDELDDDPEVEDDDGIPGEPLPQYTRPYGGQTRPGPSARRESSEGMTAKELWAEMLDRSQGRGATVQRVPEPPPPVPTEERTGRTAAPRRSAAPVHRVHLTHPEFGTDPSSRAGAGVPATVSESRDSKQARAVRARLRSGGASSLQEAMILKEVLGPPVALSGEWSGADGD